MSEDGMATAAAANSIQPRRLSCRKLWNTSLHTLPPSPSPPATPTLESTCSWKKSHESAQLNWRAETIHHHHHHRLHRKINRPADQLKVKEEGKKERGPKSQRQTQAHSSRLLHLGITSFGSIQCLGFCVGVCVKWVNTKIEGGKKLAIWFSFEQTVSAAAVVAVNTSAQLLTTLLEQQT